MAKQILERRWHHIILCLLLSFVTISYQKTTALVEMPITNEAQCMALLEGVYPLHFFHWYNIRVNFQGRDNWCPSDMRGFECGINMSVKDPYEALGSKICIDLKGVAQTIPHNQFAIIISDQSGEMERVYSKSSRFDRNNIKCSEQTAHIIKILLRVLSTVQMCPDILPSLVYHNTSLGTVFLKKEIPTYELKVQSCQQIHRHFFEEHSILKVIPGGSYRYGCAISLRPQDQYRRTQMCFTVEYLSPDFSCAVHISVKKGLVEYLSFDVPNREEWNPSERTSYCFKFYITDSEEETFPNLVFQSNIWDCHGKFALDIKYRSISDGRGSGIGQYSSINRRNLYMAVFISVIAVCIFIMGLTCLCCLRMRARNRHHHQGSGRRG